MTKLTIKTVEELKELPISDDWYKIDKSDKYFIRRETKNCFSISDAEFHVGELIRNKHKCLFHAILNNVDYEANFETFEEAFHFLIEKAKTI
ncbi:hypothetical protein [Arcobacter porcinus]|uniref:Uncharacterized protein n=1 Tax=Arcobacter porcinus TaxID=1935204 RepID=A0A5C2HJI1_9BACT|nr:hypothetical protein [Arcobacter porcinus]OCL85379.1 hypothetical protein AAX30_01879 [Arcobacter porcinus]OCL90737.1 hypothetical protein AAX27_01548 [Aliarcobacter thereius]QEP40890.1 hypothetical protein APORC_1296 [Arcobacter porcinus]